MNNLKKKREDQQIHKHAAESWLQHLVNISAPFSVMRIVFSNCADKLPSDVTAVQLSDHITESVLPIVSIGSTHINN